MYYFLSEEKFSTECAMGPVAGVLDESYSQLTPLSGFAVQARQPTYAGNVSILCSLAGRYGYSAGLDNVSKCQHLILDDKYSLYYLIFILCAATKFKEVATETKNTEEDKKQDEGEIKNL